MRSKRSRVTIGALLALLLCASITTGSAQGAKVTEKAQGGPIPPEVPGSPRVSTAFVQKFKLSGRKVRKKQITDVNVSVNATGNAADSNRELIALLVSPKSGSAGLPLPNIGSAMENLEFDDQSILTSCNPYVLVREDCNFLAGADVNGVVGTMTGKLRASLNPTFEGGNPRGVWTLYWWDTNANGTLTALGETILEVKTAGRFER